MSPALLLVNVNKQKTMKGKCIARMQGGRTLNHTATKNAQMTIRGRYYQLQGTWPKLETLTCRRMKCNKQTQMSYAIMQIPQAI